jgi:HrpA-like RNA helicase
MYSKDSFVDMMPETVPEIRRCNLSNVVLYLKVTTHTKQQKKTHKAHKNNTNKNKKHTHSHTHTK